MTPVLVIAEQEGGSLRHTVFEILGRLQDCRVDVAVPGKIDAGAVAELGRHGVDRIMILDGPTDLLRTGEGLAVALEQLLGREQFDCVLGVASPLGRDMFPRLAGALGVGVVTDVVDFRLDGNQVRAVKPIYGGRCLARQRITGPRPHLVSVRPRALGVGLVGRRGEGRIERFAVQPRPKTLELLERVPPASPEPDLNEAAVVVAGGRPLGSAENLKMLEDLAYELGAAVGASRGAVDCGFAPRSALIGQSGKIISPALYIACGISGAIHHYAGIRNARVIVAINTDSEAPIFLKCDYGIVGDMFQVVPALTQALRRARQDRG